MLLSEICENHFKTEMTYLGFIVIYCCSRLEYHKFFSRKHFKIVSKLKFDDSKSVAHFVGCSMRQPWSTRPAALRAV